MLDLDYFSGPYFAAASYATEISSSVDFFIRQLYGSMALSEPVHLWDRVWIFTIPYERKLIFFLYSLPCST